MSLIQRYYSCDRGDVEVTYFNQETNEPNLVVESGFPVILREEALSHDWACGSMSDGEEYFSVYATQEGWDTFDATYTNQEADIGFPYRRRFPTKNLSTIVFEV